MLKSWESTGYLDAEIIIPMVFEHFKSVTNLVSFSFLKVEIKYFSFIWVVHFLRNVAG